MSDEEVRLYGSSVMAQVHETAEGLHASRILTDERLAEMDERCLVHLPTISPEEIRALRAKKDVSQRVLARHLGVPPNTVARWESGEESPSGSVIVLLGIIRKHGLHYLV